MLMLLVVPVGAAETHLPAVALKDNGITIIGDDVLVPVGTPGETIRCVCYQLRYDNPRTPVHRHVPQ
jgi:hypothetical protein